MILIVYDGANEWSEKDKIGIAQAIDEIGLRYEVLDTSITNITLELLNQYTTVILSETQLTAPEASAVTEYVAGDGGILVSGKSANGLETPLGIGGLQPKTTTETSEVRFIATHPVSYGAYWEGPIMHDPPMPQDEIPTINQFMYPNTDCPGYWLETADGTVVAHWHSGTGDWDSEQEEASIVVHTHGQGRTVYTGALPGAYAFPEPGSDFTWRVFIINALEWLNNDNYLVEIGYWPNAHRAAFVWSGDTETSVMKLAVPPILDLFERLELQQFGTFYVVGQQGGDSGTAGAVQHPDVVEMIVQAGSEVGGHGDIHTSFDVGSEAEQLERLQTMVNIINPILAPYGESVKGFRAPHVDFNEHTFPAVAQAGLLYDSSNIDAWSETTFPFFNGSLWEAPPTMPMDWWLFEHFDLSDQDAITIYIDKANYVFSRRGMFNFLHHPWVIDRHLDVLEAALQHTINQGDVWMARQDAIMLWWIQRQHVVVERATQQENALHIIVDNRNNEPISGVTLWIKVPGGVNVDDITVVSGGEFLNTFPRLHNGMTYMAVIVSEIDADSSVRIILSLPNPQTTK